MGARTERGRARNEKVVCSREKAIKDEGMRRGRMAGQAQLAEKVAIAIAIGLGYIIIKN